MTPQRTPQPTGDRGQMLKAAIYASGHTIESFAHHVNSGEGRKVVSTRALTNWLAGRAAPHPATLLVVLAYVPERHRARLAETWGVPVEDVPVRDSLVRGELDGDGDLASIEDRLEAAMEGVRAALDELRRLQQH